MQRVIYADVDVLFKPEEQAVRNTGSWEEALAPLNVSIERGQASSKLSVVSKEHSFILHLYSLRHWRL